MSTEVTLFKNGVPAHLRNRPLNEITKSVMGGGAAAGKRISLRGNMFRMVVDGKEIATREERSMPVVIINVAPKVSRAFYEGAYNPDVKAAPTCWSADGTKPDAKVAKAQSGACVSCPKSVKGSGAGNTVACKYNRLIAVVLENDIDGDVFQMSLPSQSLFPKAEGGKMALNAYGAFLGGFNVNITDVVTELKFDTASDVPKLLFKAVRPLTEEELEKCTERGESDEVKAMITTSYSAVAETAAPAQPAPKPAKAKVQDVAEEEVEEEADDEPKPEPVKRAKKTEEAPAPKKKLTDVLDQWDDDDA
jgi:hypothetical protein